MNEDELIAWPPGPITRIGPLLAPSGTVAVITPAAFTTNVVGISSNATADAETKYAPT